MAATATAAAAAFFISHQMSGFHSVDLALVLPSFSTFRSTLSKIMSSATEETTTKTFDSIKNSHKEEYISVWTTVGQVIKIHVIGYKTKSVIAEFEIPAEDIAAFVEKISTIFDREKCKAVLLDIYKFEPVGPEYPHVINLAYQIRFQFDELNIKNFFYSDRSLFLSGLLISAKIKEPAADDIVLFLLAKADDIVVYEYKYGEIGYEKIRDELVSVEENDSFNEIREKLLANSKPKHIIVFGADMNLPIMKKFKKNIFAQEKLIFRDKKAVATESIQHSLKISKWVLDHQYKKYHVQPRCAKKYCIRADTNPPFITVNIGDTLPYTFQDYTYRGNNVFAIFGYNETDGKEILIYESVQDDNHRHRSKISVTVDMESFPLLSVRPVLIDLIKELPPRLDQNLTKKIPVIVFCDNFSVICAVRKGEEKYSFLDEWNGLYGRDASLLLDRRLKEFGYEANDLKNTPYAAVCDMISTLAREFEDVDINGEGGEDEHKSAVSSLCQYMTCHIEAHFEAIQKATGETVDEAAFWLLLNFDEEENARFKDRLIESFKPLGIVCHLLKLEVPY